MLKREAHNEGNAALIHHVTEPLVTEGTTWHRTHSALGLALRPSPAARVRLLVLVRRWGLGARIEPAAVIRRQPLREVLAPSHLDRAKVGALKLSGAQLWLHLSQGMEFVPKEIEKGTHKTLFEWPEYPNQGRRFTDVVRHFEAGTCHKEVGVRYLALLCISRGWGMCRTNRWLLAGWLAGWLAG